MKYSLEASRAEAQEQAINIYMWGKTLHNTIPTSARCHLRLSIYFNVVVILEQI